MRTTGKLNDFYCVHLTVYTFVNALMGSMLEATASALLPREPCMGLPLVLFLCGPKASSGLTQTHNGQERISAEAPAHFSAGLPLAATQKNDCSLPRTHSLFFFFSPLFFSHRSRRAQRAWLQNVTAQEQVGHTALALRNCRVCV